MAKILISPGKYVQGAGELKKLGEYAGVYGKKALILISAGGQKRSGKLIEDSFAAVETGMEFATFNGECSKTEIQRLRGVMQASGCDMVIINGSKPNLLYDIVEGKSAGTLFKGNKEGLIQ